MNRIRMIGLDLDGTLLTEKKELTEYSRRILEKAIGQGVEIVVATGRPITGVPKVMMEFPGIRYAITSNGGRVVDIRDGRVVYDNPLSYETGAALLAVCDDYDTFREIYFDGQGYAQTDEMLQVERFVTNPAVAHYIRTTRVEVPDLWNKMREMKGHPLDKVHAMFTDLDEREEARLRMLQIGELEITGSRDQNLEINAPGVDKGEGLLRLGTLLGIQREEIMACGDGGNDLAMIQKAGLGVAMANATEEVKAAADYVTCSNEEDGVAKAIERFVLMV